MATTLIGSSYPGQCLKTVEYKLLDELDEVAAGTAYPAKVEPVSIAWQITVTGEPTGVSVTLQGSNDKSNWTTLDTSTTTTEETRHATGGPFKFIRANLGTLTAGTDPTVTVLAVIKQPSVI